MSQKQPQAPQERKAYPVSIIATDDDQGLVEAIVNVTGIIDEGGDVVHKGAFTKTISERANQIRILDQHNFDSIMRTLGKPIELREVGRDELPADLLGQYPDADGGLYVKIKFNLETAEGVGAYKRIKAEDINEYSIGFDIVQRDYEKRDDGMTVRHIREIKLYEISPVLWGMNPATATVSAKSGTATPDETAGWDEERQMPISTVGDYLLGKVYGGMMALCANFLKEGYISMAEYDQMCMAGEDVKRAIMEGMPEGVSERAIEYYLMYEADTPTNHKDETSDDHQHEAGPPNEAPTLQEGFDKKAALGMLEALEEGLSDLLTD